MNIIAKYRNLVLNAQKNYTYIGNQTDLSTPEKR